MRFAYQHEKFDVARRCLMLPHPSGEEEGIVGALHECGHGLNGLDRDELDDTAQPYYDEIKRTMDTTGIEDDTGRGTYYAKASRMSVDEKARFAEAVDGLASWFAREFWESTTSRATR